ncbi:MAG: PHP domain-containing protein [Actinomycetia bacterium]|nr:PHP domain-containing protein [Actinomycetes bacterium]
MKRFDLHVHTAYLSDDATLDPLAALRRLEALGYAGAALTEHNAFWRAEDLAELTRRTSLILVRGAEIQTEEVGHVLVLGWDDAPVWPYHRFERLRAAATAKGAVLLVAHPYRRWFPLWARRQALGAPAEAGALHAWWRQADGLEVHNGRAPDAENALAAEAADRLARPGTGGSDAHRLEDLGTAWTELPDWVTTPADVLAALRQGLGRPSRPPSAPCPPAGAD